MSQINDGGPAFPELVPPANSNFALNVASGMSLRDYFAGQALAGWFASFAGAEQSDIDDFMCDWSHSAKTVYKMADAMIKQRTTSTETK